MIPSFVNLNSTPSLFSSVSAQQNDDSADIQDGECENLVVDDISSSNNIVGRQVAENVLDNNLGSLWIARGTSAWIQADLGESKIICDIEITWLRISPRQQYELKISISVDGINYDIVHTGRIAGNTMFIPQRYDLGEANGRYVKITVDMANANNLIGISNLVINGREDTTAEEEFTYTVDEQIEPSVKELPGIKGGPPRPVEAVVGPDGTQDEFVINEVIFRPRDQAELSAFIAKYNGTILDDGSPLLIPGANRTEDSTVPESSGWYLIRVDLERSSLNDLSSNMEQLNLTGQVVFSSQDAARLAALIARESDQDISPNFFARPGAVIEHPDYGGGNLDAERWTWMTEDDNPGAPGVQGLSVGTVNAWNYLRYMRIPPPPPSGIWSPAIVAIVDAGFDLDQTTGLPLNNNRDYFHLGDNLMQGDVVDHDLRAGGDYAGWHGQGVFGVALSRPRNGYGSAGTAGEIAYPMLIRIDGSFYHMADGIRTSVLNGANVINISWFGECNWWCRTFTGNDNAVESEVGLAVAGNAIVVSIPGNTQPLGQDIGDKYMIPCKVTGVLCVGAIMGNGQAELFSNYGNGVDIWAPDCTRSTVSRVSADDDVDDLGIDELWQFCGTSGAAPFVSGIVAMMKMPKPDMTLNEAVDILQRTSNPSTDPKVSLTGYVDAFRAVASLRENRPPSVNIILPEDGASITWGVFSGRATAQDPEQGGWFSNSIASITFTSNRDGRLCIATDRFGDYYYCQKRNLSLGSHRITAIATDIFGASGSDSIDIEVINHDPSPRIIWPPNNSEFRTGQSIEFRGFAYDLDESISDSNLSWTSNIDGPIGTGRTTSRTLSEGVHTITLQATDLYGATGETSIVVNVVSGVGIPEPEITSPRNGAQFFTGQTITFEGRAIDEEDGELPGSSLEWRSSRDSLLGTGNTISVVLSGPPTPCRPEFIGHTITLTATDSDGNSATSQIIVSVGTVC
ncbi:putative peptidase [Candidatus Nitrososphaera gargensis Ga9.2]|uniref:Putative peptidase n=1 Tax=Nitrososphaera gargensis (strain Ga9.2) TaxID=1237085 RepID=K0III3_NITGG|nr:putative peptidase [Candidatus Nitrososphaera gargensis Ga9.2]